MKVSLAPSSRRLDITIPREFVSLSYRELANLLTPGSKFARVGTRTTTSHIGRLER